MPIIPTYPGVYIEEIPSGVRTISGVATSITAFLGRAVRGPVNEPVVVNNYGDFERMFGGLNVNLPMSYAVRDFFGNGGSQALIVRLYKTPAADAIQSSSITKDGVTFTASSSGTWGNQLRVRVTKAAALPSWAEFDGLQLADLFNIDIRDGGTGTVESFVNVTVKESRRRLDRVLASASNLMRVTTNLNVDPPPNLAEHAAPDLSKGDVWDATNNPNSSSGVADAAKAVDSGELDAPAYEGNKNNKEGLYALDKADLFNLLCIPPDSRGGSTPDSVYQKAMEYCYLRRAMLIVDSPDTWSDNPSTAAADAVAGLDAMGLKGLPARNAAIYFPRVLMPDPLRDGQISAFTPSGIIAGVMSRTDVTRGVWKAPAGVDAALSGISGLDVNLSDPENGMLNPKAINCLRTFPVYGTVVWGARTARGDDQLADEYKYVPVRRLVLFIEESLYRGTKWVVFEPNDEPLWAQIRLNVGAFMNRLFKQGAFQGTKPSDAYFVKVDSETTTQTDINLGIVNIVVGFAPLKPAEFVILKIQQIANQGN